MSQTKSANNARVMYEAGQNTYPMTVLTSTDRQAFRSGVHPWSAAAGKEVVVRPNGLLSGGLITPGAGSDNVSVSGLSCFIAGALVEIVAAASNAVVRASENTHRINSVTVTAAGALAVTQGANGTAFSEVRGDPGGPPIILAGSIEIGQVRLSSATPGAVTQAEIYQVIGTHQERYDFPLWEENFFLGGVDFVQPLEGIHADGKGKLVYASFFEPIFAEVRPVKDFVAPENSHSVSSEEVYGGAIGSSSTSLGQGSFIAFLKSGVADNLLKFKDQELWFKFWPDRYITTDYIMCQGKLGIARTFPVGGNIQANCTISAKTAAEDVY